MEPAQPGGYRSFYQRWWPHRDERSEYDRKMIAKTLSRLRSGVKPDILTIYFMGLDHTSHHEGPEAQTDYLSRVIDKQIQRLVTSLQANDLLEGTLVAVCSDHGQIG